MNRAKVSRAAAIVAFAAALVAACGGDDSNVPPNDASVDGCPSGATACGNSCAVLDSDPKNCGACGTTCASNEVCSSGKCALSCEAGKTNCNGSCVDLKADGTNCGTCGNVCTGGQTCQAGLCACPAPQVLCTIGSPTADAGADAGDAGDASDASDAAPATDAAPGDAGVVTKCVNPTNDVAHCGGCGKACTAANGTPACVSSVCQVSACNQGFADCDKNPVNGCEVNTQTDPQNCNACGTVCTVTNGTPVCNAGVCGLGTCNVGYGNCDNNPGNGCETNTTNSMLHCGACNLPCVISNGTGVCAASQCNVASCNVGRGNCNGLPGDGCEVNTTNDVKNCSACGVVCPNLPNASPACTNSTCGLGACNVGYGNCNGLPGDGCEINTTNNVSNCGSCGVACPAVTNGTPGCANSTCGVGSCNAGYANCNGQPGDGCEVNTTNDVNNCSACGTVCPALPNATKACTSGVCGLGTCNVGFANCDGNANNGCEANLQSNTSCGACGVVCAQGETCSAGTCKSKVLVAGAPAQAAWNSDVQTKLLATGFFPVVDVVDVSAVTPPLQTLQTYAAVLVYSDKPFADATTLGNNLADYVDAGGRAVNTTFSNVTALSLGGRWASGAYDLIAPAAQAQPAESAALQLVEPGSPLVTSVTTLTATAAYRSTGAVVNGGVVVARWGSGTPLIVKGAKNGRARVELNFYPPSVSMRSDFWSGDGARIMANALLYEGYCHSIVGKNGALCASGKTEWCDPINPIVATSATQAKAACDTCYGISCFLETADCAGAAYGPKPAGQYSSLDAYFGYAVGCSGTSGRIFAITNSYTTYGRWAP